MAIYVGGATGLNWSSAAAKVRGDLWRPGNSLSDDVVQRALHASVLELEAETSWLWLEQLTAQATIEDEVDYLDLPPMIGRVSAVSYRKGDWLGRLTETTLSTARVASQNVGGDPDYYAVATDRLYFDCQVLPGSQFELVCSYATPDQLEVAIASPCFTLQLHQQAVIANACAYVALTFLRNSEEHDRQRAVYQRIVDRLMDIEEQQRGSGIIPDTWGMGVCHG